MGGGECVQGILANHFGCLLTTMAQEPHNVTLMVLVCVTLHNIIRTLHRADHQVLPNEEENNHRQVPGGCRQGQVMLVLGVLWGNNATIATKRQREYRMHYYNNAVGQFHGRMT